MVPYFEYTTVDSEFYRQHIQSRLPSRIFDLHVHINLPEHVALVPDERLHSDWALECGHILTCDEAYDYADRLFPDTEYTITGFPWPICEADVRGNNTYLARMRKEGRLTPFMTVRPEWNHESIERTLIEGDFVGFKPYPDMVTGLKGADVSIFTFFPKEQWEILNRYKKAVMLHLPRKERFADDNNVKELRDARQAYPDVTIILAHFGRSFCPYYLREGLRKLSGAEGFYFDTSAVVNPAVYDLAFSQISPENILYGSDMPVVLWHGKRTWTEREYTNHCRESFSWKKEHAPHEVENQYTFFIYKEMEALLDGIDKHGFSTGEKEKIFFLNAKRILGSSNSRSCGSGSSNMVFTS